MMNLNLSNIYYKSIHVEVVREKAEHKKVKVNYIYENIRNK